MIENAEVESLKRRLKWEGAGSLAELSNRTMDAITARGHATAIRVRESGEDRPLLSLLIALQLGFAVGRWGPRRAKH
jgi:hypothetical protein